jgi:transcription antitermination factor NusA-like protein
LLSWGEYSLKVVSEALSRVQVLSVFRREEDMGLCDRILFVVRNRELSLVVSKEVWDWNISEL